jgi:hypothetical protein
MFHFFFVYAPKADWTISVVANGKNQAMRDAVDISVSAKSWFVVIETIVFNDFSNFEIKIARQ